MERGIRWVGTISTAVALAIAPAAVASGDCDILEGACGATKTVTVTGVRFADAVANASQSHGEQHTKKIEGNCDLQSKGGSWILRVPQAITGRQTCEINLLTGGKSHSKMNKSCAIWGWNAVDTGHVDKNGVGGESGRKIVKQPVDHTRQKRWTVKLWNDPGLQPPSFRINGVTLKVPERSSLKDSSNATQIRNACFQ